MTPARSLRPASAAALVLAALVLGGCAAGGPSPAQPTPSPAGTAAATPPPPTPVPGSSATPEPRSAPPDAGGGGDVGGGLVPPPGTGPGDPAVPAPTFVVPVANLTGIHPVRADGLSATVEGRRVSVQLGWWSGVEPCSVLAGVAVERDGDAITLTVNEGSARDDAVCVEMAVHKATVVDLGELDPGTWTIRVVGEAAPVEVTIAG